jgi:hypothetical protein
MLQENISFMDTVISFEKEMFAKDCEVANACDHIVFMRDKNYAYGLQYDITENTFSIVAEVFEDGEDSNWSHTEFLETFPVQFYNREFLVSKIVGYINESIINYQEEKKNSEARASMIKRMINHDKDVYADELYDIQEFAQDRGFSSIVEYYHSLSNERLNDIAYDYFFDYEPLKIIS